MFTAKDIEIRVIDSKSSRMVVERFHYSHKCTQNSQLHFGVFLNNRLEGALQFGPSIDKRRMAQNLNIGFNEFLELNRMALSDRCPKNSESRALGICLRIIKKQYPHLKLIVSFADACQCGDGTIYRASGFILTAINKNTTMYKLPNGKIFADIGLRASSNNLKKEVGYITGEKFSTFLKRSKAEKLKGNQLRYIYLIDKTCKITVPILPFSKIDEMGAGMYKGEKITIAERQT